MRHNLRLAMRCLYSATGFFIALLAAGVAHDGFTLDGALPVEYRPTFCYVLVAWIGAVLLDWFTGEPDHHKRKTSL